MKKYQIIGGQYEYIWIGESDSLHGAKMIATKNREMWDNWQGWHTPEIYRAEDVKEISGIRMPKEGRYTKPFAYFHNGKWQ